MARAEWPAVRDRWPELLQAAMDLEGVDRKELARRSGLTVAAIGLILTGERGGTMDTHVKLARALGRPTAELFPRDEWEANPFTRHKGSQVEHYPPWRETVDVEGL